MGIWYTTREEVKSSLDIKETARNNSQVDRAIEAASRSVEKLTHRKFYPFSGTRYIDWPNSDYARSGRLWLDGDTELVSLTTFVSGGVTIASTDYFLEPNDSGPPYDRIDIDRGSTAALTAGSTSQRSVALTGVFGYNDVTESVGSLVGGINSSVTTIVLDHPCKVGELLTIGSERMVVTEKALRQIIGSDLVSNMSASTGDTLVDSGSGLFYAGEVIAIDSEKMLVEDVSGANYIVKRAWDGSTLAAHTLGTVISAYRTFTVTRAQTGTAGAAHTDAAAVSHQVYPGPIVSLTIAEAMSQLQQEGSAYGRVVGSGDNAREARGLSLGDLRQNVYEAYGRRGRIAAV